MFIVYVKWLHPTDEDPTATIAIPYTVENTEYEAIQTVEYLEKHTLLGFAAIEVYYEFNSAADAYDWD